MAAFDKHTRTTNSILLSMKEWLCVLLLLMPVALAKEHISVEITNFSPSQVELNCYSDYEGNMKNVFFGVYKAGYSCLTRNAGWCNETHENNCNINCLSSELPENLVSLPFLVKLNGLCDEVFHVQCTIRNAVAKKILNLEESIEITPQSDPPKISVNNGHRIEAGPQPVQLRCTVTNMCHKNELDVSVEVPMLHINTTHTQTGNRFNTTSISQAIFSDPGNYTIICKEMGKNHQFSRSSIVVAHPSEKVIYPKDHQKADGNDEHFKSVSIGLILIFVPSTVVLGLLLYFLHFRKMKRSSDPEAVPSESARLLTASGEERYMKIENLIQKLTHLNIYQLTGRILLLVNEGEIAYPEDGRSIIYQLIEKMEDLHREPQFPKLIQGLLPSYKESALSKKEDLSEIIWAKLEYNLIKDRTDALECLHKLMNFSLDVTMSFRLLWRCSLDSIILEEQNKLTEDHWLIVRFLIAHFADTSNKSIDSHHRLEIKVAFLQAILEGYMKTVTDADVLNFTIQSVPNFILEHDSNNVSPVKELLVQICGKMLESNAFCKHTDSDGRTPLHNLLEKLPDINPRMGMSELASGTDGIWNLATQLISKENVNICDKNGVTPYSWILWWKELIPYQNVPDKINLENKIEEIVKICQKEASEKDASRGLTIHREREMEGLLKMMMKLNMRIIVDEETFRKVEMKLKRLKVLKRKGCGECINGLTQAEDLKVFAQNHMHIWNDKVLEMSQVVLELLIVEANAQDIYDTVMKTKNGTGDNREKVNYVALFGMLKLCLDKGACPTSDQIYEISLLNVDVCTAHEAQLAAVKIIDRLIGAYRKQGNNMPIEIYMNPIQDQWKVSEELRRAAGEVVRAAYGTLDNCLKSDSVINILLFLRKDDGDDAIKKFFERVDELLQKDMADPPVMKWAEGKMYHIVQAVEEKEIKEMLITRNDNWLRRSVLHLAAIFCQDEQVLKCIPKELIDKKIDGKDINGHTPLHIAHLHENTSAIRFLETQGARSCADYLGKFPKSLKSPYTQQYKEVSFDVMETKSSVFEAMKNMLISPVNEYTTVEKELKELFTKMVSNDELLNAERVIVGSGREKLKISHWNDFSLQIYVKSKPYGQEPLASLKLHEHFVKRLAEIDTSKISLKCISVGDPWTFVWDGEGTCKGLPINVDVKLILIDGHKVTKNQRQEFIIDNAPGRHRLCYFQWNYFMSGAIWRDTFFEHEWDILVNLPPQCRLGILIAMVLIESQDLTTPVKLMRSPVTTNVLKHTLLWILAGKTPGLIEIKHGNVIGEQYGALRQQLYFEEGGTRWMTEEDLKRYAKDGRFWAEKIFDAIEFMAREYKATLDSFLTSQSHDLNAQQAILVQNICQRCLKRLAPQVFFTEKAFNTSEMDDDESGLRTKLQEIINMLNREVGTTLPGALLWKKKKEVKELQDRIETYFTPMEKGLHTKLEARKSEVTKLHRKYVNQPSVLKNEERDCQEIEEDIELLLKTLGNANQRESKLFQKYGGNEEMQMKNKNPTYIEKARNAEKSKLENDIDIFHRSCKKLLVKLEENSRKLITKLPDGKPDKQPE